MLSRYFYSYSYSARLFNYMPASVGNGDSIHYNHERTSVIKLHLFTFHLLSFINQCLFGISYVDIHCHLPRLAITCTVYGKDIVVFLKLILNQTNVL